MNNQQQPEKEIEFYSSKEIKIRKLKITPFIIKTLFKMKLFLHSFKYKFWLRNDFEFFRQNYGQIIATVMAFINLYRIRQRIMKYVIYYTKSVNRNHLLVNCKTVNENC